jgi:hypothetical protein
VQVNIFSSPYHEISSVGHIHPAVGSDTIKKFVDLTHLIKPVNKKGLFTSYKYI